jgi:hypothetical protein
MALKIIRRQQEGISVIQLTGRLVFGEEDNLLNEETGRPL